MRDREVAHQIRRCLAAHHEGQGFLPAVGLVVVDKRAHVDQFAPVGEGRAHTVIGPRHFTTGQLHVEVKAVGAHVEVVKPAASSPQELGADGVALATAIKNGLAVGLFLLPCGRLFQTQFVEDVLAVINAPLIVGIGHAPLLAVDGHRTFGGGKVRRDVFFGPQVRHVFKQAGRDVRRHPVGRIPRGHIGRVCGQEVADLRLVGFAVDDRGFDVQIGVHLAEAGDHVLHRRAGRGVRCIQENLQIARQLFAVTIGQRAACQNSRCRKRRDGRFEHGMHGFLPSASAIS